MTALTLRRFGWVNASYVYGLQLVNAHMKRALGAITDWETFAKVTEAEYDLPDGGPNHKPHVSSVQRRRSSVAEATRNAKISAQHQAAAAASRDLKPLAPAKPATPQHDLKPLTPVKPTSSQQTGHS